MVAPEPCQAQGMVEGNHSLLMRAPKGCARVDRLVRPAMLAVRSLKKHATVFQKGVMRV